MRKKSAEKKINLILSRLKKKYKEEMQTSLDFKSPWELLVATMLSAQSQDTQVNKVTPALFKDYKNPAEYAALTPKDVQLYIRTLGLYKVKSRNIVKTAKMITNEYDGVVPKKMEQLVALPGVGRKTANVVLSNAFGENHGIAIDTHCITVANRLFLYNTKSAEKIEEKLMQFVPKREWANLTHLFIALGRDVCTSRRKICENCVLKDICPSSTVRK